MRARHLLIVGTVCAIVSFLLSYRPNDAQRIGELPRAPASGGLLMLPGGDRPFFIGRSPQDTAGLPDGAGIPLVLPGLPPSLFEARAMGTSRIVGDDLYYIQQTAAPVDAAPGGATPAAAGGAPAQELLRQALWGGRPTHIAAGKWTNPAVGEHFLYWTEQVGDNTGPWDLKALPLEGGEARTLFRGQVPIPHALGESVCWSVQADGFPPRRELVLYNDVDGSQTRIPDPGSAVVEAADRLYWVDDSLEMGMAAPVASSAKVQQGLARWALISADRTGGNPQRIPFPRDRGATRALASLPVEHRGDLYCMLEEFGGPNNAGWARTTLFRYRPGPGARLERLRRLSDTSGTSWFLSGPWVYYTVLEERGRWLDLAPRSLESRKAPVLYRVRLP